MVITESRKEKFAKKSLFKSIKNMWVSGQIKEAVDPFGAGVFLSNLAILLLSILEDEQLVIIVSGIGTLAGINLLIRGLINYFERM